MNSTVDLLHLSSWHRPNLEVGTLARMPAVREKSWRWAGLSVSAPILLALHVRERAKVKIAPLAIGFGNRYY